MDKSFFSEKNITSAYKNLCKNRKKHPANSDIWHFRFHWPQLLPQIINEVKSNNYRLKPMQVVNKRDKTQVVVWSSQDAFVIHLLTLYLQTKLPVHKQCQHVKGHGGGKQSVRELSKTIPRYRFVCRTDIKGYYSNVKKNILLQQIRQYIDDPIVLDLISQFIYYTVENGGLFHTPNKGIARSSPLSPLLGAFHLYCIDEYFSDENIYPSNFKMLCSARRPWFSGAATIRRYSGSTLRIVNKV
ncbi:hypothetical protein [Photobacterium leiognathi]|uniref:hypothetical protein n=2 Tax=Photobacterium leiognathi TaxID=553611 RepID=UPI0029827E0C|nr:hypothetical protein [Photobacterium leiognathi]